MEKKKLEQLEEFKKTVSAMFQNCEAIHRFDRSVYISAYGEKAVLFVEDICEAMPDTSKPNVAIQSALNIAYDKGFEDCMLMVISIMERTILNGEASFS